MPLAVDVAPLAEAVSRISAKTPIGSLLKSADWANVPLALRERAFFSATVESAQFLDAAHRGILQIAEMARKDGGEGAYQSRQQLVADLQGLAKRLGLGPTDPAKAGTLEDVTSLRRLELIVDFNTTQAQEFAKWKTEQDPDVLDAFPAQELVRIEDREVPRDWQNRWRAEGGALFDGRMVALKTDPIWTAISAFGTPFPPFDFGSGMGIEDVDRDEAEQLGLLKRDEQIRPVGEKRFNDELSASVENLTPRMQGALGNIFGDQVTITEGRAKWTGGEQ